MRKISYLLVAAMAVLSCSKSNDTETAGTFPDNGNGSASSPYEITTASDLVKMAEYTSGPEASSYADKCYVLKSDIDMSGKTFTSICSMESGNSFSGTFDGNGCTIDNLSCADGLFGSISGGTVSDLVLTNASVSGKGSTGAICAEIYGGSVIACKAGAGCKVTSSQASAGGIVGTVSSTDAVVIDRCTSNAEVSGAYGVGGVAGTSISVSSGAPVNIVNSLYCGNGLRVTGSKNGVCMAGGIAGQLANSGSGVQNILNCMSVLPKVSFPRSAAGVNTSDISIGGILGMQKGPANSSSVKGCWSTFQIGYLWREDAEGPYNMSKLIDNNNTSDMNTVGGIAGSAEGIRFEYCYWFDTICMVPKSKLTNYSYCETTGPLATNMLPKLKQFVSSYKGDMVLKNWIVDGRGYPVPQGLTTDIPGANQLRVAVIGDSISTFKNWIPTGYAIYYSGQSDCDVTFDKTYWYQFAYKMLENGRIEKNIAWSGSCVCNCDSQTSKPGFTTRMASSGIGSPDIVLIHGGTNDRNRNVNATCVVDNTAGFSYTQTPTKEAMEKLFATPADKQNTRYYLDSTVKLVQQINEAHPKAKIVLVIGDRLEPAMETGVKMIADHYDNCIAVDFRVAGYNNLPKYSGSHPTAAGHYTMASTIDKQFMKWVEF